MHFHEELLDVVDEQDNVIDIKPRSEVHQRGLLFRAICGFIRNSTGQLWIPRRTADKKLYPLGLDMSVAGHVESGETYEQAFSRELNEELNLTCEDAKITLLGKVTPAQGFVAFTYVWEIHLEAVPPFNSADFIEYFWLTPEELLAKLHAGAYAKSDLAPLIEHFYVRARSSAG